MLDIHHVENGSPLQYFCALVVDGIGSDMHSGLTITI